MFVFTVLYIINDKQGVNDMKNSNEMKVLIETCEGILSESERYLATLIYNEEFQDRYIKKFESIKDNIKTGEMKKENVEELNIIMNVLMEQYFEDVSLLEEKIEKATKCDTNKKYTLEVENIKELLNERDLSNAYILINELEEKMNIENKY